MRDISKQEESSLEAEQTRCDRRASGGGPETGGSDASSAEAMALGAGRLHRRDSAFHHVVASGKTGGNGSVNKRRKVHLEAEDYVASRRVTRLSAATTQYAADSKKHELPKERMLRERSVIAPETSDDGDTRITLKRIKLEYSRRKNGTLEGNYTKLPASQRLTMAETDVAEHDLEASPMRRRKEVNGISISNAAEVTRRALELESVCTTKKKVTLSKSDLIRSTKKKVTLSESDLMGSSNIGLKKISLPLKSRGIANKFAITKTPPRQNAPIDHSIREKVEIGNNRPDSDKQNGALQKKHRSIEKQKLRDQIKAMLLNAGWKIDLRKRRNRNYEDSVYISPEGGSGYWSITKAYRVFQQEKEMNWDSRSNAKLLPESLSDGVLHGSVPPFAAITDDAISMLKRKVLKKRRTKKELAKEAKNLKFTKKASSAVCHHYKLSAASKSSSSQGKKRKTNRMCPLRVRDTNIESDCDANGYALYDGKRTVLAWMIDLGTVPDNGRVGYMTNTDARPMLEGRITRDGIQCNCCSEILSPLKFEIHAGSKLCQPYQNIKLEESAKSLLQCELHAWEKQMESEKCGFYSVAFNGDDPNDDTCGICGDGGDLICCDSCPSTFHLTCLGIQMLPSGDWHCSNCTCRYCGSVDCFSVQEEFCSISLISCSQCEEKYHHDCIPKADAIPVESKNPCSSFCGQNCSRLFGQLHKLLGVKNVLEPGYSWSIVKRIDDESSALVLGVEQKAECNAKIAVALTVMDECFLPIDDQRSGINLIHSVVYNCGSNFNRLNYSGFHTFILEKGDEIISVASLRFHGTRLAEMPFIGTRYMYRRQGMCRRILNAIEVALSFLNVEKLVIPAISELLQTWTTVFGFKPLDDTCREEVKSVNLLVFPGTGLLEKSLVNKEEKAFKVTEAAKPESDEQDVAASELSCGKTCFGSNNGLECANLYNSAERKHEANIAINRDNYQKLSKRSR